MSANKLQIIKTIILTVCMILVAQFVFTVNAHAIASDYPYAIQVAVFGNVNSANRYFSAHKQQLNDGLILKSKSYHVLYGVYTTKKDATAHLKSARKVEPKAYVLTLNSENRKKVASLLSNQKNATTKTVAPTTKLTVTAPNKATVQSKPTTPATNNTATTATTDKRIQIYNVPLQQDVVINGVKGISSITFNVSTDWHVTDNTFIEVYISHAAQNFYPESSVTILLNGVPIHSYFLTQSDTQPAKILVPLSPENIKTGFNELQIKTYLRTEGDLCENETNPSNWIVILKKSYLHISYTEQIDTTQIFEYPYPYVKTGLDQPLDFSFVYDTNQPNAEVLKSIFTLSADLGRLMPYKTLNYKFVRPIDLKKNDLNYIYLGTTIPDQVKAILPKTYKMPSSNLFISEVKLDETRRILLIISKKPELLSSLANMLNYTRVVSQLRMQSISFSESDLIQPDSQTTDHLLSFKELGYANVTFEATKQGSAGFFIDTPSNWKILEGTKLVVKGRFSALVNAADSTLSAIVNGIPIGSRILDANYKDGQIFEFVLPKDVLDSNRFNVVLAYSLGGEFKCDEVRNNKGVWGFISNDSYLQFAHEPKESYKLQDLPSPLVADGSFSNLNLAMNKNATFREIELMANLMGKLGHQTTQSSDFSISFDSIKEHANNLVIGTASTALIKRTNQYAKVPYDTNFNSFKTTPGIFLMANAQSNYATAQLLYDKDSQSSILWISSITPSGFEWVGKYMCDLGLVTQISGDVIFVSRDGLLQNLDTTPKEDENTLSAAINLSQTPRATFENIRNFLIFLGIMLLIIILIIIMTSKKNKKKKG